MSQCADYADWTAAGDNQCHFRFWQLPYYWAGIKAYDFVSGSSCLKQSYILGKERALEAFPMLKRDKLKGAIVYYDGRFENYILLRGLDWDCVQIIIYLPPLLFEKL